MSRGYTAFCLLVVKNPSLAASLIRPTLSAFMAILNPSPRPWSTPGTTRSSNSTFSSMHKNTTIHQVEAFHKAFKIGCANQPTVDLADNILELRFRLMEEENLEYLEAAKNKDMVEVADALGDMLYILCGTILTHGMQHKIEEVFDEIQRSNMSKLGADGAPIYLSLIHI